MFWVRIMNNYTTGKFAKKAGVTERTLRYYDKIGLLKPKKTMTILIDYIPMKILFYFKKYWFLNH